MVNYEGESYNASIDKTPPILIRQKVENPVKSIKPKVMLIVQGEETDEKPPKESKDVTEGCYRARKVVLIDPALAANYDALMSLGSEK